MVDLFAPPRWQQGDRLPSHTHVARNTSTGGNMVHDDAVARQHGFSGGLVPGVTTYAYWASDMARALGPLWVVLGESTIALRRPVYEGEEVVSVAVASLTMDEQAWTLRAEGGIDGPDGVQRVPATATVEWSILPGAAWYRQDHWYDRLIGKPLPVPREQFFARSDAPPRHPDDRPTISRATAPLWEPLPPVEIDTSAEAMVAYLHAIDDDNPLFREPAYEGQPFVHPGLWATAANRVLDRNFQLPLWVHTKSVIRHSGAATAGGVYRAYGKLIDAFERNGHDYVTAWVDVVSPDGREVARIEHTAIVVLASAKNQS